MSALRLSRGARHAIFVMRIQIKSGRVKEVYVARSTGHSDLDAATVQALKQWRFKPDALPPIKKFFLTTMIHSRWRIRW